jgi:hypothetical protein
MDFLELISTEAGFWIWDAGIESAKKTVQEFTKCIDATMQNQFAACCQLRRLLQQASKLARQRLDAIGDSLALELLKLRNH